jgi:enoyl-CoA hydratase
MHFENLLYETRGPLALITLNRPDKLNAISLATVDELHAAIAAAADDPAVRVLAITGAGDKAFAAGSDLAEVVHRDLNKALAPIVQGVAERLERCPKPTIAAINGICFGGGLEVALGCDLRVAGRSARFATPEGKLGIIPGGGATQRLPRLVGRAWALDMLLMGEPIDAERALHIGLVTRLVDDADLLATVQRMAEHLAGFAPLVPRYMKAMVHAGMEGSLAAGLCETADKKEGLAAFLEKRPPQWQGR